MSISGISSDMSSSLASQASNLQGGKVQQEISVSILKQSIDQQKAEGEAIVKMIQATPVPGAPGGMVDVRA
jgi:hypothetical protein